MERDQSTGAFKAYVKVVGLLLLISMLSVMVFEGHGTPLLGYLLVGGIGFLAWRMFRVWDKLTVQVYALIQSWMTAIVVGQLWGLFWPETRHAIAGVVLILFGSAFERFLVRYTGFQRELKKKKKSVRLDTVEDVTGTTWQNDPGHVAS